MTHESILFLLLLSVVAGLAVSLPRARDVMGALAETAPVCMLFLPHQLGLVSFTGVASSAALAVAFVWVLARLARSGAHAVPVGLAPDLDDKSAALGLHLLLLGVFAVAMIAEGEAEPRVVLPVLPVLGVWLCLHRRAFARFLALATALACAGFVMFR